MSETTETGTGPGPDETARLAETVARLEARVAVLEATAEASTAGRTVADIARRIETRSAAAWAALRGRGDPLPRPDGTVARAGGWLGTLALVALGVVVAMLAVEVVEEVFHGLSHLWRGVH